MSYLHIGNTPMARYRAESAPSARIFVKQEQFNGSGSVKDRPAYRMIASALDGGTLQKGGLIVEATSGNMGISLAYVAKHFGIKTIFTMPSCMSSGRRRLLERYGAQLVLTDDGGMEEAVKTAERIAIQRNGLYMRQFCNSDNMLAHYFTTAEEILTQCPDIDVFVAGVGTGGTLCGTAKRLKEYNPAIEIIAVEPSESAVISGGKAGKHVIEGIGANFVPQLLDMKLVDRVVQVSGGEAIAEARRLNEEGFCVGYSSGANIAAAKAVATDGSRRGANIVTLFADSGDRYSW
ncbi:MAG: cysteine synthase family protein [Corallococcus sp.]|nr:cysteine synthase family protein [Corallococcus sp.]